ncbi:carbohydrate binding protein with CBM6 domain [Paenibacillus taihuensis]|uniref:Carbohydrate binding protein with CBM6 domain n=1 Tax=Paenibacillus taihuensis TaxID=1156355 RepID=A0A3D9R2Y3_9BACL|nr:carbohydrate binding protein with CBM6 domain [Paenibacillus taihuensis]
MILIPFSKKLKVVSLIAAIMLLLSSLSATIAGAVGSEVPASASGEVVASIEAEAPANTFTGNAGIRDCNPAIGCSGGKKAGDLWGGSSMQFNNVEVPAAGVYTLKMTYISGDPRPITVTVNGGAAEPLSPPKTANWDTLGTFEFEVLLQQGANTIKFDDNGGWSPDIDKIELLVPSDPSNGGGEIIASIEGEAPANTFTGNAGVRDCNPVIGCSGGKKAGDLWGGSSLQFNNVEVPAAGTYTLNMYYISGDPRPINVTVNGGAAEPLSPPPTANWDTLGTFEFQVLLQQGANTIKFDDNGGWSPDIDKIELIAADSSGGDPDNDGAIGDIGAEVKSNKFGHTVVTEYQKGVTATNGDYTITYNTESGLAAYAWNGKTIATGVYSSIQLDQTLTSKQYAKHQFAMDSVKKIHDAHGKGLEITIDNKQDGLPTLQQIYRIYDDQPYFLVSEQASSNTALSTNDMAPIVIQSKGGVDIGKYADNRVLITPYDNDSWSRYQARTINTFLNTSNYISSEMTAIYDNDSRNGLVIGSVTHDTWKTGVSWSGSNDRLNKLKVYGGFTSPTSTHDTQAHGKITETTLTSPQIFVGFYADYREGLEGYGQANAEVAPLLEFEHGVPSGVPVGWNSWGAYDSHLSYDKVVEVSNFFKENLQNNSFNNKGNVYINLDSYWDNMSAQQLKDIAALIKKNGQKPGIYYSPFVYWGNNMNQPVEGTNGAYTYGDLVLKDENGNPLPTVDGAYAIDPTHPAAKQRIDYYFNLFKAYGFEYIKIDFLSHGSLEGKHYDSTVKTGIQAYNQGMAYIDKALEGKMFISASIAPLFPSQYAHARRISCDVDGTLGKTEYQLNNLTYGWWQNGTIYRYTDPDYMALVKGGSLAAAQTRVNAAAISGTVYLDSDDVSNPTAQTYMKTLLTNPRVNAVALMGEAFAPVEGNTGTAAADQFVLKDKKDYYLAVFNYTQENVVKTIDLARAGIPSGAKVTATDLWTNTSQQITGPFTVSLGAAQSMLYKITVK